MDSYDLVCIGGGAAGFFSAVSAAECAAQPLRIAILEKGPSVLQKVRVSGGGRCNVTHDCHDAREFAGHYPRGNRALPGPLTKWSASDMIDWLSDRGVELKVEEDGRMFPGTDDSQTIIDCLQGAADELGVEVRCRAEVASLTQPKAGGFLIELKSGEAIQATNVVVATGGIRNPAGAEFAASFGHEILPAAPSLFTFKIRDPRIEGLAGVSVPLGRATVIGEKGLSESGPILVTHWGLSGPGILKVSARGARVLQQRGYRFTLQVDWVCQSRESIEAVWREMKENSGKQTVHAHPQCGVPSRLWRQLATAAQIEADEKWGNVSKAQLRQLLDQLVACELQVDGKSMNKEEFVTCGGVDLRQVDMRTMQSQLQPGLYFTGEVLDIDGVTGGFNFQSAWSTGRLAGRAIAATT